MSQRAIPFMRLDRQFAAHRDEFLTAMMPVLEVGNVLQGEQVGKFEHELAAATGIKHAITCGSGTDALTLSLLALGLAEGSRIAVPAMTFIATGAPILHARCVPVFVDCDPETGLADESALLALIEKRAIDAIIVVHLYGQLMDLTRIAAAAAQANIAIIEDAAQALGAMREGTTFGRVTRVSTVSFDPMKVVGAFGSGGAVLTDDATIAARVRRLRYHGQDRGRSVVAGFNSQLPTVQAAILSVKLKHMQEWQERRTAIAGILDRKLAQAPHCRRMRTLPGNVHNWHKYVLWIDHRDDVKAKLQAAGVGTKVHYEIPLHQQPLFAAYVHNGACPVAEQAAAHVLSLPIYPELTDEEAEFVAELARDALESVS